MANRLTLMRLRFLLLTLIMTSEARASSLPPFEIFNLGAPFQAYRAEVKRLKLPAGDTSQHMRLFKEHVVRDQTQFYLDVVFDKRDQRKTFDEVLSEALQESVPLFDKHEAQIDASIKDFETHTREQMTRLLKAIPDFKVETPIYGMISLNKFAGGVRSFAGKQVLAIAFDKLAAIDRDFSMIFAHESFHVYHHQANPKLREELGKSTDLLIAGMFIEGIATFAEGEINPDKRHRRMVKGLEVWCSAKGYMPYIAEFLADNDKLSAATYEANKDLYRKWFYTARGRDYPFPTEAAYCIGDQVVSVLAAKHNFRDMARWSMAKVIAESRPILEGWRVTSPVIRSPSSGAIPK